MWGRQVTNITKSSLFNNGSVLLFRRNYMGREVKKFYKNVTISQAEGGYEINLDKKKLKTPLGTLFKVPNEALALVVANEWNSQQKVIKKHMMHMTTLCNTVIDNPTERSKETKINGILEFLDTDTICYRLEEPRDLSEMMKREWDPLLQWVHERYGVTIQATSGLGVPHIPKETKDILRQHMMSHNEWAIVGYQNAVESIKSFIITSALIDRHVTIEKAVSLARLEEEFQIQKWGNVEWHHSVDEMEQRARLASSVLFVHLNREDTTVTKKIDRSQLQQYV